MRKVYEHGDPINYRAMGCRCDLCREAHRLEQIEVRRRRKSGEIPLPKTVKHGRYTTFRNWYCHCGPCTEANTAKCREFKERRRSA